MSLPTKHLATARRWAATTCAFVLATATIALFAMPASAVLVANVPMGTSANYAVLGASTVTNSGTTTLDGGLGLWPGTSVTGAPTVLPPWTTDVNNAAAQNAQTDLTTAFNNAASRPVDFSEPADLGGLTLAPGVHATTAQGPLELTGALVLDGEGDPNSVFIIQTDSSLTTHVGSTVTLINSAQECNVYWQVGSFATLAGGSEFAGNILAATSITVAGGTVVHGRALALGASVSLDTDTFTVPTCDLSAPVTTTTSTTTTTTTLPTATTTLPTTTTTLPTTTTTVPVTTTTTLPVGSVTTTTTPGVSPTTTTTVPASTATTDPGAVLGDSSKPGLGTAGDQSSTVVPRVVGPPRTGGVALRTARGFPSLPVGFAVLFAGAGLALVPPRRRPPV